MGLVTPLLDYFLASMQHHAQISALLPPGNTRTAPAMFWPGRNSSPYTSIILCLQMSTVVVPRGLSRAVPRRQCSSVLAGTVP